MYRGVLVAGLIIALVALPALGLRAEEKQATSNAEGSKPVISIKANMGGRNVELDVEQTKDGVEVTGTMDNQSVTATGTRQEDGSVRVEVQKDEDTMVEMTINPDAVKGMGSESQK
jgi:hypothetical protein